MNTSFIARIQALEDRLSSEEKRRKILEKWVLQNFEFDVEQEVEASSTFIKIETQDEDQCQRHGQRQYSNSRKRKLESSVAPPAQKSHLFNQNDSADSPGTPVTPEESYDEEESDNWSGGDENENEYENSGASVGQIKIYNKSGSDSNKIGRKKEPIWNHFHVKKNPNPLAKPNRSAIVYCKKCRKQISARAQRMKEHWEKCTGSASASSAVKKSHKLTKNKNTSTMTPKNTHSHSSSSIPPIPNDSRVRGDTDEESDNQSDNGRVDPQNSITVKVTAGKGKMVGRRKEPIWDHFNVKTLPFDNNNPFAKKCKEVICKNCGGQVSSKAHRLKEHWNKCTGQGSGSGSAETETPFRK